MSKDEMRETTIVITVVVQKMESRPDKTVKSLTPVKRYMRVEKRNVSIIVAAFLPRTLSRNTIVNYNLLAHRTTKLRYPPFRIYGGGL